MASSLKIGIMLVKKLDIDAQIPTYVHPSDAGMDLYAAEDCWLFFNRPKLVKTGIAIKLPGGVYADVRPYSLMFKKGVHIGFSTIDEDDTNEIVICCSALCYKIHKGDKIAQLVLHQKIDTNIVETNELPITGRTTGCFTSTRI